MTVPDVEILQKCVIQRPNKILGIRHVQYLLLFLASIVAYGIRTNMSVGIIAMISSNPPNPDIPTYPQWTQKETILSSFFWGYIIPQIGAGHLINKYGPKWFLVVTMFLNSLFTLLVPTMASAFGEGGVIACRVIQGLSQGFLYPSAHSLLSKWTPKAERSRAIGFVYAAASLGTVIALPVTGAITNSSSGWPVVFYLYGGLGIGWSALWGLVGADDPAKHRRISEEERRYIEDGSDSKSKEKPKKTPWLSVLTSLPFWAVLVAHSGQNWGFWTLMTEIPSYMNKIMNYNIKDNSLLSALPYLVLWLLSFVFCPIADFIIVRRHWTTRTVRKVFNSIGFFLSAAALVCLSFINPEQKTVAMTLLVCAVAFNSAALSGLFVNHIDLAPNHAGFLMAITNTVSNVFSLVAPLAVKVIPFEESDPMLWRYVFCIAAGVYVVTDLFFVVFGSGEIQGWNEQDEEVLKDSVSKDIRVQAL